MLIGNPIDFSVYFGHTYDLEVDMTPDFLITSSSTLQEEKEVIPKSPIADQENTPSNEQDKKQTSPSKTNTKKRGQIRTSQSSQVSLTKGSNSPSVYQIDLLPSQNQDNQKNLSTSRIPNSRAPISMSKLAQRDENDSIFDTRTSQSVRSNRSSRMRKSARSERPIVECKTYVFGFKNESSYIPKSFIPSHKPKPAPERPKSARMQPPIREYKNMTVKLASKRDLGMNPISPVCHSVILGNFDDADIERKF